MINWVAIGSLAEFVGAVGVIASLIYLAVQVRQNTQSIRASTYDSMMRSSGDFLAPLIQDSDLAKSFERAVSSWSGLDSEEQVRTMYLLTQLFRNWENAFYQNRQGTLEPWLWDAWRNVILSYFHQPGIQEWWHLRRVAFSEPFQTFLESSLSPEAMIATTEQSSQTKTLQGSDDRK